MTGPPLNGIRGACQGTPVFHEDKPGRHISLQNKIKDSTRPASSARSSAPASGRFRPAVDNGGGCQ